MKQKKTKHTTAETITKQKENKGEMKTKFQNGKQETII